MSLKQPKKKLNNVSSLKRRTRPHSSKGRVYNYNVFPIRRIENSTKDYYMCNPYQLKTDEKYIDKYYMGIMKDIFKSEVKFMVNNLQSKEDYNAFFMKPKLIQQKFSNSLKNPKEVVVCL